MTASELIAALQREPPDAVVHIAYCYGDHWRTRVAPPVARVESGWVKDSAYHGMPKVVDGDDLRDDELDQAEVVLLSGGRA